MKVDFISRVDFLFELHVFLKTFLTVEEKREGDKEHWYLVCKRH